MQQPKKGRAVLGHARNVASGIAVPPYEGRICCRICRGFDKLAGCGEVLFSKSLKTSSGIDIEQSNLQDVPIQYYLGLGLIFLFLSFEVLLVFVGLHSLAGGAAGGAPPHAHRPLWCCLWDAR